MSVLERCLFAVMSVLKRCSLFVVMSVLERSPPFVVMSVFQWCTLL